MITVSHRDRDGKLLYRINVSSSARAEPTQTEGANLWGELHAWALSAPDTHESWEWLAHWERRVVAALGMCGCWNHWQRLKEAMPPAWDHLFEWSVAAHNAVNRRLGKHELAIEEARAIWLSPTP